MSANPASGARHAQRPRRRVQFAASSSRCWRCSLSRPSSPIPSSSCRRCASRSTPAPSICSSATSACLSLWSRDVPWRGELCLRSCRKGLGARSGAGDPGRRRLFGGARPRRRRAVDPQPRHLLRDDHRRAVADGLFLLRARRPSPTARTASRACRRGASLGLIDLSQTGHALCLRRRDLPVRLSGDLSHHQFAVRRSAQGDPRERAARDFARLPRRPLQARRLRPVGGARGPRRRDQGAGRSRTPR